MRAYSRIVLVPSGGLAGPVRLPCAQVRGLCLNANDEAELARRLLRAHTRGLCLNANDEAELARRLLRAQARGLCCPRGAPVPPALRLPACKRGLCWQPATNFAQHTALLCAQARVALFGVGGRGQCLSRYTHIARPISTPSASPHATSRG